MKKDKLIYIVALLLSLFIFLLIEKNSFSLLVTAEKYSIKSELKLQLQLSKANKIKQKTKTDKKKLIKQPENNSAKVEHKMPLKTNSSQQQKAAAKMTSVNSDELINKEAEPNSDKLKINKSEKKTTNNSKLSSAIKQPEKKLQADDKTETKISQAKKDKAKTDSQKFDLAQYLAELKKDQTNQQNKNDLETDNEIVKKQQNKLNDKYKFKKELKSDVVKLNSTAAKTNQKAKSSTDQASKVYDLTSNQNSAIQKPTVLEFKQPAYPVQLQKRNIEGTVIISLIIDKTGQAIKPELAKSSGFTAFDQAALEAANKIVFEPAQLSGQKVTVKVKIPITFKLE